jgi:hypothetical protein
LVLVVVVMGLIGILYRGRKEGLLPFTWLFVVVSSALIRMRTYSAGDVRYLMPIYPVLIFGLAWLFDFASRQVQPQIRWGLRSVLAAGLISHGWLQLENHQTLVSRALGTQVLENAYRVIQEFRQHGIDFVISNDYWHSNQYMYFSEGHPVFMAPPIQHLTHPEAVRLAGVVHEAGYLASATDSVPAELNSLSRNWRVERLATIGDRSLYRLRVKQ